MPLHWQLPCFLLGAVASGATAVVASSAEHLSDCSLAFVSAASAEAALDAGVDDVLAVSGHPLGARLPAVPPLCLDAAVEVPGYGDHWSGPRPASWSVELDGAPFEVPDLGLGCEDRVLTALPPSLPGGLGVLLGALHAGASLVLLADGDAGAEAPAVAAAERATATAGVGVPGLRLLV